MGPKLVRDYRVVIFIVALALSLPAKGQEPLPVFVVFDFGHVGPLKKNPTAAQTESSIATCVVECLKDPAHHEYFPWDMRVGSIDTYPKIKVLLVEDPNWTKWELRIEAYTESGALTDRILPLQRIVADPGELELRLGRRTPQSKEFPGIVSEWLKSRFLEPNLRPQLQRLIMAVAPLGDCSVLTSERVPLRVDDAKGVLQVDWEKVRYLYKSSFTVVCEAKDKSLVELGSEGDETPVEFDLSGRKKLGLMLKHKTLNNIEISKCLSRLLQLGKGRVYLENFKFARGLPPGGRVQVTDQ
jgi:hypothetical protein